MKRAAAVLLALLAFSATTYDPAKVAPDLPERVARFKRVEMPFTYEGLTARERRVVDELIAASRDLEDIFWRQDNPEDIYLCQALAGVKDERAQLLRRYLWINGSR